MFYKTSSDKNKPLLSYHKVNILSQNFDTLKENEKCIQSNNNEELNNNDKVVYDEEEDDVPVQYTSNCRGVFAQVSWLFRNMYVDIYIHVCVYNANHSSSFIHNSYDGIYICKTNNSFINPVTLLLLFQSNTYIFSH